MNTLNSGRVSQLLLQLHRQAEQADRAMIEERRGKLASTGKSVEQVAAQMIADERADYRAVYSRYTNNFLSVTDEYGRFLYSMTRASKATRVVEFGTSMGVSTIYLAAALRDNGGGLLIASELEASKIAWARKHLEAAGLADLVEIREGDALETLQDLGGEIDLAHIDGAWSLYLPVLKLIEPRLRPGAIILGENSFSIDYLEYVREPANGYFSRAAPINEGRGNEMSVRVA